MELSTDAPKFPKWPFLVSDVVLIGAAAFIAQLSDTPLPAAAIYAITACVAVGALLAVLPFLIDYNRRQDVLLSERQGALEALVRTTSAAVEQASIAATGLNEIAELAQKNLRLADQLPHKLQERVNEFNRGQEEALNAEIEALQQEVNTLRASEAEKLDSAADKIARAASELTKLEPNVRKQIALIEEAAKRAQQLLESSAQAATTTLERRLKEAARSHQHSAPTATSAEAPPPPAAPVVSAPVIAPPAAPVPSPVVAAPVESFPRTPDTTASTAAAGDRPALSISTTPSVATDANDGGAITAPADSGLRKAPAKARRSVEPASAPKGSEPTAPVERPPAPSASPPRKLVEPVDSLPGLDEAVQEAPDEGSTAIASDGATRLIVTAYIGIGNKLYVRGEGPGLSWDHGTPLQFVSIGKWRWETSDARTPIVAKLYKNDQVECTRVGEIRLQPGHQRELTATFS